VRLDCGEIDIGVLLDIDPDILEEAVDIIKDKYADSEALNFSKIFSEAVWIAAEKEGIVEEVTGIDANYAASRVYVASKEAGRKLEQYGIPVVY